MSDSWEEAAAPVHRFLIRAGVILFILGAGLTWWLQYQRPKGRLQDADLLLEIGDIEDVEEIVQNARDAWFPIPGIEEVQQQLDRIGAARHLEEARRALYDKDVPGCRGHLERAAVLDPGVEGLAQAQDQLAALESGLEPLRRAREALAQWRVQDALTEIELARERGAEAAEVEALVAELDVAQSALAAIERGRDLVSRGRWAEAVLLREAVTVEAPSAPGLDALSLSLDSAIAEHLDQAEEAADRDRQAWFVAHREGSLEGYLAYLASQPEGAWLGEARTAILQRVVGCQVQCESEVLHRAITGAFGRAGLVIGSSEDPLTVRVESEWKPLRGSYSRIPGFAPDSDFDAGWALEGNLTFSAAGTVLFTVPLEVDTGVPETLTLIDYIPQGYSKEYALRTGGVLDQLGSVADQAVAGDNRRRVSLLLDVLRRGTPGERGDAIAAFGVFADSWAANALVEEVEELGKNGSRQEMLDGASALVRVGGPAVAPAVAKLLSSSASTQRALVTSLGEIGDVRAAPVLARRLSRSPSLEMEALEKMGAPAVPALLEVLDHERAGVRQGAAEVLGRIGDVTAVEGLLELVEDEDAEVCREAMKALGVLGDARAVASLVARLEEFEAQVALGKIGAPSVEALIAELSVGERERRMTCVGLLGRTQDPRAVEPILPLLKDPSHELRLAAVRALGKIGDARAVPPLLAALEDEEVLYQTIVALGELGDLRAVEPLIGQLGHPTASIRRIAIQALVQLGDQRAAGPVRRLVEDPDSFVRRAAESALLELR